MKNKEIAVILLVFIALVVLYQFYFLEQEPNGNGGEGNPELTMKEIFEQNLQNASEVYIIMDITGASGNISDGILQCGVDLAGSFGLVDKEKNFFGIDKEICTASLSNGTVMTITSDECFALSEGKITIHIVTDADTVYFENKLVVSIDEQYTYGDCKIQAVEIVE